MDTRSCSNSLREKVGEISEKSPVPILSASQHSRFRGRLTLRAVTHRTLMATRTNRPEITNTSRLVRSTQALMVETEQ